MNTFNICIFDNLAAAMQICFRQMFFRNLLYPFFEFVVRPFFHFFRQNAPSNELCHSISSYCQAQNTFLDVKFPENGIHSPTLVEIRK